MDWKLLGVSFVTVFLAELGDKSQLAAIALSGNAKSTKAVFFGSVMALVLASFIGVVIGEGTANILPTQWTKTIAAIGFAVMAVRLLCFGSADIPTVAEITPKAPESTIFDPDAT